MDGDGDAPRLAPSSCSVVTRESLFKDWQREVEDRNECGPHNVPAYDYIHARLNQIGNPLNNQAQSSAGLTDATCLE